MRPLLIFVVVFIAVDLGASEFWEPQLLGTFQLKDAGFVEVFQTHPQATNYTDRYTLYLTTFNFGKKKIFYCTSNFFWKLRWDQLSRVRGVSWCARSRFKTHQIALFFQLLCSFTIRFTASDHLANFWILSQHGTWNWKNWAAKTPLIGLIFPWRSRQRWAFSCCARENSADGRVKIQHFKQK